MKTIYKIIWVKIGEKDIPLDSLGKEGWTFDKTTIETLIRFENDIEDKVPYLITATVTPDGLNKSKIAKLANIEPWLNAACLRKNSLIFIDTVGIWGNNQQSLVEDFVSV